MNISPVSTSCLYPNGVTVLDDVTPGNVVADKMNLSLVAPYLWVYLRTTGPQDTVCPEGLGEKTLVSSAVRLQNSLDPAPAPLWPYFGRTGALQGPPSTGRGDVSKRPKTYQARCKRKHRLQICTMPSLSHLSSRSPSPPPCVPAVSSNKTREGKVKSGGDRGWERERRPF